MQEDTSHVMTVSLMVVTMGMCVMMSMVVVMVMVIMAVVCVVVVVLQRLRIVWRDWRICCYRG